MELCREVGSPVAFATLLADTDCGDPKARVQASLGILAYAWGKPRQALEVTGKDGGPVQTEHAPMPLESLTDEELATMKEIAKRVASRSAAPAAAPPSEPADVRPADAP